MPWSSDVATPRHPLPTFRVCILHHVAQNNALLVQYNSLTTTTYIYIYTHTSIYIYIYSGCCMLCNTLIAFGDVLGQRASLPHNVLFAVVWVLCRAPRAAASADSGCRAHGPFYFVRYSTSEDSCKNKP